METVREHDKLYLSEQRYDRPKEAFKFMVRRADQRARTSAPGAIVCDIGCAAGEFAYFLTQQWPEAEIIGYDVLPELVERAREMVPKATFACGSVLDANMMAPGSADIIFMAGVLSIFDDYRDTLNNVISAIMAQSNLRSIALNQLSFSQCRNPVRKPWPKAISYQA